MVTSWLSHQIISIQIVLPLQPIHYQTKLWCIYAENIPKSNVDRIFDIIDTSLYILPAPEPVTAAHNVSVCPISWHKTDGRLLTLSPSASSFLFCALKFSSPTIKKGFTFASLEQSVTFGVSYWCPTTQYCYIKTENSITLLCISCFAHSQWEQRYPLTKSLTAWTQSFMLLMTCQSHALLWAVSLCFHTSQGVSIHTSSQ